jgi:hypothetical protein
VRVASGLHANAATALKTPTQWQLCAKVEALVVGGEQAAEGGFAQVGGGNPPARWRTGQWSGAVEVHSTDLPIAKAQHGTAVVRHQALVRGGMDAVSITTRSP